MSTPTILSSPLFTELILPFLLVFALVFAILDKIKLLGEGKKQINAIIAFVIGLIFVSFFQAVQVTVNLLGVTAVAAVILLVFMMLYGFAIGEKEFKMPKGLKITFGILIAIVLIVSLLVSTGYWEKIVEEVTGGSSLVTNIFFIGIVIAAIAIVFWSGKKEGSS